MQIPEQQGIIERSRGRGHRGFECKKHGSVYIKLRCRMSSIRLKPEFNMHLYTFWSFKSRYCVRLSNCRYHQTERGTPLMT